jgi:hypothetical protein
MIISYTHNFIFIKTRKVGGTSFEKYIIDNHFDPEKDKCTGSIVDDYPWYNIPCEAKGHMPWEKIKEYEPSADTFRAFTFERNPWDKCVSQYYFFRDKIKAIPKEMSFSQYLELSTKLTAEQGMPIDRRRYNKAVNCIIVRWEDFLEDLPVVMAQLGIKFDFDAFSKYNLKSGVRKDKHYSTLYTDRDIEIVRNAFKWEVENLKYEFEDERGKHWQTIY